MILKRNQICLLAAGLFVLSACRAQTRSTYDSGGPLSADQAAYDVTYYELVVQVKPDARRIDGLLTVTADIVHPTISVVLDLDDALGVHTVVDRATQVPLSFHHDKGKLRVALPAMLQAGSTVSFGIAYGGEPREAPRAPWDGGFTWSKTPSGAHWIATTCQGEGADLWWPVKDHPSDEPDSMRIRVTVPANLVAASNGRLESVDQNAETTTYNWFVSTPINTYNVALNIAPYEVLEDTVHSVDGSTFPVQFFVLPEDVEKGRALLPEIKDQLHFFEATLGPYPFRADKYGVAQTPHLGMEHQTIIAYGAGFDNSAMTGRDWGFDALHQHELSHEWWGNLVTNADWKDMWLHEGFGTYMQPLYVEARQGREAYLEYMSEIRRGIANRQAVAPRDSKTASEIYVGDIYSKGAFVLHTLRYLIGDQAFFTALRDMAYPDADDARATDCRSCRFVTTDDFVRVAEAASGMDLDWFFEVYVRQPRLPKLIAESADGATMLRWDTPGGLRFPMPIPIMIGEEQRRVEMADAPARVNATDFSVDPEGWVLKEN